MKPVAREAGLGPWAMIALALPALPMSALTIPLVSFLPEFYANSLGLSLATVGTVFMVVRLLDLGVDPVLGSLMDRTRSRWGRYKPWLVAGVPLVTLSTYFLMFARPGVGPVYLTVWLLLTYLGFSVIVLSQLALTAAQTRDYHERSRAFGWWQAAYTAGILCVVSLPMLMGGGASNDRASTMHAMGAVVLVATPLTVLWTCLGIRDHSRGSPHGHADLGQYLRLLRRRSTRLLLTAVLLYGLATGVSAALGLIYILAVKQLTLADFSLQMLVLFATAIFTAPLWVRLARRVGKHGSYAIGGSLNIIYFVGLVFTPVGQIFWIYALSVLAGLAYAAANQMPRAMLADVNDEELLDHGGDRTGMLYALVTGVDKIGFALAVGLAFSVLDVFGYLPAAGSHNPARALQGVEFLYCGLTTCLIVCACLVIARYPLTATRHALVRRELDSRNMAAASAA